MSTAKEFQYLQQIGYNGSIADKRNAYYTDLITNGGQPDRPTVGEIIPDREQWISSVVAPGLSGQLILPILVLHVPKLLVHSRCKAARQRQEQLRRYVEWVFILWLQTAT